LFLSVIPGTNEDLMPGITVRNKQLAYEKAKM